MKFADLITRLENYFKDDPGRLNKDLMLIVDDLQAKFSEYKRIKKVVFKRQVEKAYRIVADNDTFVNEIETKIEIEKKNAENDEESDIDVDSESLDEQALAISIKGDCSGNQANNMITTIYKMNTPTAKNSTMNSNNVATSGLNDFSSRNKSKEGVRFEGYSGTVNNYNDARKRKPSEMGGFVATNIEPKNLKYEIQNGFDRARRELDQAKRNNNKRSSSSISSMAAASKDLTKSEINFDSFACEQDLKENIFRRIYYVLSPEHFLSNGKTPPRGFLLHGPPGCGKTQLVYAIAGELDLPLLKVTSTELISGVSGESEENIRVIFEKAVSSAPCILFIDEIEAISQRRETASKNMEHRIVTQLLSCFDDLAIKPYVPLVVIGATNQVDSLDIGLRRAGRFDQEIPIGIPDEKQRRRILEILCRKIKLNSNIDLDKIILNTPGYVGADLNALIDESLISSLDRRLLEQIHAENMKEDRKNLVIGLIEWIKQKLAKIKSDGVSLEENLRQLEAIEVNQNDFDIAIGRVQPSSKREGFATVPDVSWDDIGALENVRDELKTAILAPVKYARQCEIFNFTKPPGILMVGPPGCGKTLLAKAIARESGVNFISVKGPELLNMYVGESERAVRSLFQRARNSKPCVIFFDEIDAICSKRSDSSSDGGSTTRVVNQLLTEMDGLESRKGVFLMAASNRPDIIDPAILRPGRLDKIIYVGLPNLTDRLEILKTITKNGTRPRCDVDVNFENIAQDERSRTFTGADLSALVREASEFALKEFIKSPTPENELVKLRHFELAFKKIKPSVSTKDCEKYEKMKSMCVNLE